MKTIKLTVSIFLSIITSNVNELSAPLKNTGWLNGLKKQDPSICCLNETHFRLKDTQTESKQMEKEKAIFIFHENENKKKRHG